MKRFRAILLSTSAIMVFVLICAGMVVRAGNENNSYSQAVLFSEIFNLVQDNYVDPVDGHNLLDGAYESMLGGLDPNGAYLTPPEVESWKAGLKNVGVGPAISVLKLGRTLQVVAVEPNSAASDVGIEVGDQIRTIDDVQISDLSLGQVRQVLIGRSGSPVKLELVHPFDDYERETVEVVRQAPKSRPYDLQSRDEIGYLHIHRLRGIDRTELQSELEALQSRGVVDLLIDLRNAADDSPRDVAAIGALFVKDLGLALRNRHGDIVERSAASTMSPVWNGRISLLLNGATAGGAEGLAKGLKFLGGDAVSVFGEESFGLGAEPELFPLDNGGGLLVSALRWEVAPDSFWHGVGVKPDEVIRGSGDDYATAANDQLDQVLNKLRSRTAKPEEEKAAA